MSRLKIAYITATDARTKRSWSGTNYFLAKTLEKHIGEIEYLGPLSTGVLWTICSAFNFVTLKILGKRFNYRDSEIISKTYARKVGACLKKGSYDLIIAPAGTAILANLHTTIPTIYINDRSVPGAIGYHHVLSNLFKWSERESIEIERKSIARSAATIYSSSWAATAAKKAFPVFAQNIHVIPFGANIDSIPLFDVNKRLQHMHVKLLFVGVKWEEKGGDIAYETLQFLRKKNIHATLTICGCQPPTTVSENKYVIVEGFLRKEIPAENLRLQHHFTHADFLIVPTRFEAYGLVFCEAAAYGLPALATNTGGVSEIVIDNKTGILFNLTDRGETYGNRIIELLQQPDAYYTMRKAARIRYETILNWEAFAEKFQRVVAELLESKSAR